MRSTGPTCSQSITTRIEGSREGDAPVLLGNGNPVADRPQVDGTDRHYAVWHDPHPEARPISSRSSAAETSMRDARQFHDQRGSRGRARASMSSPAKSSLSPTYAMDALKRSMRWDEEAFGRAYDLDVFNVVAVSDFNMGAMENKGLNIFNDKYVLASPPHREATAIMPASRRSIAHEYFHNWTGNRITCRDWFQLSPEGGPDRLPRPGVLRRPALARSVKRIADVRALRARQFAEDGGPLAHSVRPDSLQARSTTSTRRRSTRRAPRSSGCTRSDLIGPDAFAQAAWTLYFERFDGTADDRSKTSSACFAESFGARPVGRFFRWYVQAGTPRGGRGLRRRYDAATLRLTLDLKPDRPRPTPGQPDKRPLRHPAGLRARVGTDGADRAASGASRPTAWPHRKRARRTSTIELATAETRRVMLRRTCRAAARSPRLLRGFSAPVKRRSPIATDADLGSTLLDTSTAIRFNRWEAVQSGVLHPLAARRRRWRLDRGSRSPDEPALAAADPRRRAGRSGLRRSGAGACRPRADIAREIGRDVDPDAIHAAREALRHRIGAGLRSQIIALYETLSAPHPFSPDAASAGRRALRSTLLGLIAAGDAADGAPRCAAQFDDADNMTDRLGALGTLCALPLQGRDAALEHFYDLFQRDALVVDKWLAVQAMIPEPGTLERVRTLLRHPAFSLTNPNRVYALIGSFAANPTQFNRRDGAGYDFLADFVLELDAKNPQVAARLLNAFRSWRMMDAPRRAHAEAALRRVKAGPDLSPDVRDIADRCLG